MIYCVHGLLIRILEVFMNSSFFKFSCIVLFLSIFFIIFSFFNLVYSDESAVINNLNTISIDYTSVFYEYNNSRVSLACP